MVLWSAAIKTRSVNKGHKDSQVTHLEDGGLLTCHPASFAIFTVRGSQTRSNSISCNSSKAWDDWWLKLIDLQAQLNENEWKSASVQILHCSVGFSVLGFLNMKNYLLSAISVNFLISNNNPCLYLKHEQDHILYVGAAQCNHSFLSFSNKQVHRSSGKRRPILLFLSGYSKFASWYSTCGQWPKVQ